MRATGFVGKPPNDKKVYAIKAVRAITGMGLAESKAIVDELCMNGSCQLREIISVSVREDVLGYVKEALNMLAEVGVKVTQSGKAEKYVNEVRKLCTMMVMDGENDFARDLLDMVDKWC